MYSIYPIIVSLLLIAIGAANLVYARRPAPPWLEPRLGAVGRKMRALVSFVPEHNREMAGRILAGVLLGGSGIAVLVTQLMRLTA